MTDPTTLLTASSAALLAVGMTSAATLRAWSGWLELKKLEIERGQGGSGSEAVGRPEIVELKQRIRKLEAIASGVEI